MTGLRNPLNLALVAALVLVTVFGFLAIPEGIELAVHWGLDGRVDSTMPRDVALLEMPAATLVVWVIVGLIGRFGNSGRGALAASGLRLVLPGVTTLFLLLQALIVLLGAGLPVPYFQPA